MSMPDSGKPLFWKIVVLRTRVRPDEPPVVIEKTVFDFTSREFQDVVKALERGDSVFIHPVYPKKAGQP